MTQHNHHDGAGIDRKLHDPIEDRLIPLEPLDLANVRSIDGLVRAMSKTAFTGRQIGECADTLEAMARDADCFVVMTLAGAMTVAKQGLIVAELIDRGIVNAIVSTGALMAHGLVEATGRSHFRYNPEVSDEELYEQGYNRVYDTLEPETNLDDVEKVMGEVLEQWDPSEILCSYKLNHAIGEFLARTAKGQRGILKSAFEKGVPVFVPAFTDSELGLDVALSNRMRESAGRHKLCFDPFEDLEHFASTLLRQKRLGIFPIGGGGPRGGAQDGGRFGPATAGAAKISAHSSLDGWAGLFLVEDQDGGSYDRGPEAAFVADRRLGDVRGADDFVGDTVDFFFLGPGTVGVEFDVEGSGQHLGREFLGIVACRLFGFAERVVLAEIAVGIAVGGNGNADT